MDGWFGRALAAGGYPAVAALMLLENVFPPIPSELIMPYAGFVSANGPLTLVGVVLAGIAGSVGGALSWYSAGRRLGRERLKRLAARRGRWLTVGPDDVDRMMDWFARYGPWAVLLGRVVPGARTLVSLPAGVCGMPLPKFLIFTTAGTAVWVTGLAAAGAWLGQAWERVGVVLGPLSTAVFVVVLAVYLVRVARGTRG